jgi:hypothetical protein
MNPHQRKLKTLPQQLREEATKVVDRRSVHLETSLLLDEAADMIDRLGKRLKDAQDIIHRRKSDA